MGITIEEIGFFTAIGVVAVCLIKSKLDENDTTNQ